MDAIEKQNVRPECDFNLWHLIIFFLYNTCRAQVRLKTSLL